MLPAAKISLQLERYIDPDGLGARVRAVGSGRFVVRYRVSLAVCMLMAGAGGPVAAQPTSSVPFTCVGASADQREAAASVSHTLKLVFAEPSGHFLADVATQVSDANGNVLLHIVCGGPWLLLDLAPGQYRIEASFEGESKTVPVTVGQTAREQLVTF